jgi:hypothetical protein
MVFSYYLSYIPYNLFWRLARVFRKKDLCLLHIEDAFDYYLYGNIAPHMPDIDLVTVNPSLKRNLKAILPASKKIHLYPFCFPDAVIMFRNAAWKYPVKRIVKVGMEHGAYNFKQFPKTRYYNMFDLYLMTSFADMERLISRGAATVKAIGYPKSDSLFSGKYTPQFLDELRKRLEFDTDKHTVLFSSTWDGSGMSAIEKWYDRLDQLSGRFNIMVTLHPRMSPKYVDYFRQTKGIHFVDDMDIYPYILCADVCIGDTNSLIAEFCIADKPIVTFSIDPTQRTMDDVISLISSVSIRIDTFREIEAAIQKAIETSPESSVKRKAVIKTLIDPLDGKAGKRAAEAILDLLSHRGIKCS